jgi:hypothetical protein
MASSRVAARRRGRIDRIGLLWVGLALLAGCTGGPSGAPTPATSSGQVSGDGAPSAAPPTAYDAELANVAPDGSRTVDSALRLFAMAFGAIPGVEVARPTTPIRSGTFALAEVEAHWDELTADQQAAVQRLIAPPPDATTIVLPPMESASGVRYAAAALPVEVGRPVSAAVAPDIVAALEAAAIDIRERIAAKLGSLLPGPATLVVTGADPGLLGLATQDFSGGTYQSCTVTLYGPATTAEPIVMTNTLAHELFHCFEAAGAQTQAAWQARRGWWVEGGAEWVGDVIGGQDLSLTAYWAEYLTVPRVPLLARTYDAEGFFAHLDEIGTSPWSVFPAIFAAPDDAARFVAAGAKSEAFLDSWPSGVLREPARGRAWDTTGPGITDDAVEPEAVTVASGGEADVSVPAYAGAVFSVQVTADVVLFAMLGHARLSDGRIDTTALTTAAFCTRPGGCPSTCPDGSPLPQELPPLAMPAMLALTGGGAQASGTLNAMSLDEFCKTIPRPPSDPVWLYLDEVGLRIDAVSCTGPQGSWSGLLRWGSLPGTDTGYLPDKLQPYLDLPIAFEIVETSAVATVKGSKTIGGVAWKVSFDLTFTLNPAWDHVSVIGSDTVTIGRVPTTAPLSYPDIPLQPAPAGRCP